MIEEKVMTEERVIEEKIFELCEKTLKILRNFKQDRKITKTQFEQHSESKLAFIKKYSQKDF